MQGRKNTLCPKRRLKEVSLVVLCAMFLCAMSAHASMAEVYATPQILMQLRNQPNPNVANVKLGDTLTMRVNLTDFAGVYAYQVAFKYNGTILNFTSISLNPPGGIFNGHQNYAMPEPKDMEATPDMVDNLNWALVGASLLGEDGVDVTNGVLCEVNFTVIGTGQTNLIIATSSKPVVIDAMTFFSCNVLDTNLMAHSDFVTRGVTVLSGVANSPPIAFFTVSTPPIDNTTFLLLYQNPPVVANWMVVWIDLPAYFNASNSYAPTGKITAYIWDFGDGNVTVVNATSQADALVTHVYHDVTWLSMSLTVVGEASDGSTMKSDMLTTTILVDMALQYYDWTWLVYTVFGIVGGFLVIATTRSVVRRLRRRRALKTQEILAAERSSVPRTVARAT